MTAIAGLVQSLDRAMTMLTAIAEAPGGLRLGEIAASSALAPSTCHRLLATMERRRFVQFDPRGSVWLIGREAFRVGSAFVRRSAFVAPSMPAMRLLRDQTRETVNIGAPDDGSIVILAQVESREVVCAINIVGGRAPLSSSGLGKAILSRWNEAALENHLERHGLPRCTDRSIVDPVQLRDELAVARARGFATDREEHFPGLHCVAAPILGPSGDVVAALSVSGLAVRLDGERLLNAGRAVADAAARIGAVEEAEALPRPAPLSPGLA